jgi:hypothetical protein
VPESIPASHDCIETGRSNSSAPRAARSPPDAVASTATESYSVVVAIAAANPTAVVVAPDPLQPPTTRIAGTDSSNGCRGTKCTRASGGLLGSSAAGVAGSDFGMHDTHWLSRFRNRPQVAANYSRGRVLIAGDAMSFTRSRLRTHIRW